MITYKMMMMWSDYVSLNIPKIITNNHFLHNLSKWYLSCILSNVITHTHTRTWMAVHVPSMYIQILNMVLHKHLQFFSVHTSHRPHYCCPTTIQIFFLSLSFSCTFWCPNQFQPLSVWDGAGSLKSMAVWLEISLQGIMRQRCCYDYYAMLPFGGTWNNGGAEGHPVRSISAQCNQSHTSSWSKNKHLDFQSIMWRCCFFVCAWVLMCA